MQIVSDQLDAFSLSKSDTILLIYESITGNSKKLACSVHEELEALGFKARLCEAGKLKLHEDEAVSEFENASLVVLLGWVKRSSFSPKIKQLLEVHAKHLCDKKLAIMYTAGFVREPYPQKIYTLMQEDLLACGLSKDQVLGFYLCQGKMPESTKQRYLSGKDRHATSPEMIKLKIANWEEALKHPSEDDLKAAKDFISQIIA